MTVETASIEAGRRVHNNTRRRFRGKRLTLQRLLLALTDYSERESFARNSPRELQNNSRELVKFGLSLTHDIQ